MHEITVYNITKNGETTPLHLELPIPAEQIVATAGEENAPSPGMTSDYIFRLSELNDRITEPQRITDLNAFAGRLSELSELERVLFTGAVEITDCCDIADGDEILYNLDCFELAPNVGDYKALGRQAATEQFANLPPDVLEHLDYERLGKIKYADDASAFVSGHRVFHNGQEFDAVNHSADPLQGYCLKLRLVSDENADGVWIKFPLHESGEDDFERCEEIQVALAALKSESLDSCSAAECICEYPSLNRCVEAHAGVKLTDLVWKARNFTYAESELTQYGKDVYEKLWAALEMEDCTNLDLAADITQNLRCYHFGRDPEAFAESYLEQHKVDPILTTCFDLKALGEKLVADHGMVSTANGLISHNGNEFVYDCYDPAPKQQEHEGEVFGGWFSIHIQSLTLLYLLRFHRVHFTHQLENKKHTGYERRRSHCDLKRRLLQ